MVNVPPGVPAVPVAEILWLHGLGDLVALTARVDAVLGIQKTPIGYASSKVALGVAIWLADFSVQHRKSQGDGILAAFCCRHSPNSRPADVECGAMDPLNDAGIVCHIKRFGDFGAIVADTLLERTIRYVTWDCLGFRAICCHILPNPHDSRFDSSLE